MLEKTGEISTRIKEHICQIKNLDNTIISAIAIQNTMNFGKFKILTMLNNYIEMKVL